MARQGLKMLDVRHTLPNVKYLLYVLTAGSTDVPARKAGGVRGLLRAGEGVGGGTPMSCLSRRESEDSVKADAGVGGEVRAMVENGGVDGRWVGGKAKEKTSHTSDAFQGRNSSLFPLR